MHGADQFVVHMMFMDFMKDMLCRDPSPSRLEPGGLNEENASRLACFERRGTQPFGLHRTPPPRQRPFIGARE